MNLAKMIDHTLLRADATRIGASSGVKIMAEAE